MKKDTINLIKESASTFMNIAEMTQYRIKYVQERGAEDKGKMYKHAFLAGVGILSLDDWSDGGDGKPQQKRCSWMRRRTL